MSVQGSIRNQRMRGSTIKQTLQFSVLLVVSIWLLYQIMQPHEVEPMRGKPSQKLGTLNLGRKGNSVLTEGTSHLQDSEAVELMGGSQDQRDSDAADNEDSEDNGDNKASSKKIVTIPKVKIFKTEENDSRIKMTKDSGTELVEALKNDGRDSNSMNKLDNEKATEEESSWTAEHELEKVPEGIADANAGNNHRMDGVLRFHDENGVPQHLRDLGRMNMMELNDDQKINLLLETVSSNRH